MLQQEECHHGCDIAFGMHALVANMETQAEQTRSALMQLARQISTSRRDYFGPCVFLVAIPLWRPAMLIISSVQT